MKDERVELRELRNEAAEITEEIQRLFKKWDTDSGGDPYSDPSRTEAMRLDKKRKQLYERIEELKRGGEQT